MTDTKPAEDKTPAFLRPLYPYRAVGEALDTTRLDDPTYLQMNWVLYELKCPNPACVLNVRTQGVNVKAMYEEIRDDSGCPACKLQFGPKDEEGYTFKEGEIPHEVLKNNGRWEGFIVRRVIHVAEDVFAAYGQRLYGKSKEQLTRAETDAICEEYYRSGDWREPEAKLIENAKAKHAEMERRREEAIRAAREAEEKNKPAT